MLEGKIVEVTLAKFVANQKNVARFIKGEVIRETGKALLLRKVTTVVKPHVACCHCNTKLTNPVSRRLGVGPVCIVKYGPSMWGINVTATEFDNLTDSQIKQMIKQIEGTVQVEEMWVPKRGGYVVIGEARPAKTRPQPKTPVLTHQPEFAFNF